MSENVECSYMFHVLAILCAHTLSRNLNICPINFNSSTSGDRLSAKMKKKESSLALQHCTCSVAHASVISVYLMLQDHYSLCWVCVYRELDVLCACLLSLDLHVSITEYNIFALG